PAAAASPASAVATASATPPSAPLPQSVHALPGSGHMRFAVTKGEGGFIIGSAVHDWTVADGRYELRSRIETVGLVALFVDVKLGQVSRGHIDAEGLHPDTFQDNRKDGQYRSSFDWADRRLTLSNGTVLSLGPEARDAQDLLSMFYQLGLYPLAAGQELALMVTTGRKFERYAFRVEGEEDLMLNPRTDERLTPTWHLVYRGRDSEAVDVWLARDLARLPVKIRYTDRKGGITEMTAENVDYAGKP
ncbi:MAG TPA: DUF3108 domain-containing protein, partial [Rhodocyclaceae bacterium]|nr:DUF3108 domain-containing protein [Rhodocyclaceae bacterium]